MKGKWKIVQEFKEEKWRLYDMDVTPPPQLKSLMYRGDTRMF